MSDQLVIRSAVGRFSARLLSDPEKMVQVWEVFDIDGEIIETIKTLHPFSSVSLLFYEKGWKRAYDKGKADGVGEHYASVIDAINRI